MSKKSEELLKYIDTALNAGIAHSPHWFITREYYSNAISACGLGLMLLGKYGNEIALEKYFTFSNQWREVHEDFASELGITTEQALKISEFSNRGLEVLRPWVSENI